MNDECEHVVFSHDFEIGNKLQFCSDGHGSIIFDPGWVGSAIYGLSLGLENVPKKVEMVLTRPGLTFDPQ